MNGVNPLVHAVRRLRDAIREMNDVQRHMTIRRLAMDSYPMRPDRPPETYAEFLVRTRGPALHEPPARQRAAGRLVR